MWLWSVAILICTSGANAVQSQTESEVTAMRSYEASSSRGRTLDTNDWQAKLILCHWGGNLQCIWWKRSGRHWPSLPWNMAHHPLGIKSCNLAPCLSMSSLRLVILDFEGNFSSLKLAQQVPYCHAYTRDKKPNKTACTLPCKADHSASSCLDRECSGITALQDHHLVFWTWNKRSGLCNQFDFASLTCHIPNCEHCQDCCEAGIIGGLDKIALWGPKANEWHV